MTQRFRLCTPTLLTAAALLLVTSRADAQVNLAQALGRQLIDGADAGATVGTRLDRGDLNGDINNIDLVVGAPNWSSGQGRVYVQFGWLNRSDDFAISGVSVTLTGGSAG